MIKLKEQLMNEIEEFRKCGYDFLEGKLSVIDFKKISGGMGVYAQRQKKGFMIRFRIPSGITSVKQMQWILDKAEEYNLEKIHLTTREAIQFHDLTIDQICDLMKEALENNIYTRGAGGNYPRNVAISPLSGVDKLEAFDVTPYALIVNDYFLKRITSYKLPRKLKVSFSSSNMDCGHCTITDLGFLATKVNDEDYFRVFLGGGLGANPMTSIEYPEMIKPKDILYHVEAITQMMISYGDYNNKHKARVRMILSELGKEEFLNKYKEKLDAVKANENLDAPILSMQCLKEGKETELKHNRLFEQKQDGLYSVYYHPVGGQLYLKDLKNILDTVKEMSDIDLRLTMTEGMYIRNLTGDEAEKVIEITQNCGAETHLEQSISCIGVPICQMGICESQKLLSNIISYFKEREYTKDILPRVHISGCMNSCGIHEAALIGFAGTRKRINGELKDAFEVHVNGSFECNNSRLGKVYGCIECDVIPEFLYELAKAVEEKNINFQDYLEKYNSEFEMIINKYIIQQ